MAVCRYHRDRPGIGVCVRCRKAICSACCTRLDGINYCHECLKTISRRSERRRGRGLDFIGGVGSLLLACALFLFLFWQLQGALTP